MDSIWWSWLTMCVHISLRLSFFLQLSHKYKLLLPFWDPWHSHTEFKPEDDMLDTLSLTDFKLVWDCRHTKYINVAQSAKEDTPTYDRFGAQVVHIQVSGQITAATSTFPCDAKNNACAVMLRSWSVSWVCRYMLYRVTGFQLVLLLGFILWCAFRSFLVCIRGLGQGAYRFWGCRIWRTTVPNLIWGWEKLWKNKSRNSGYIYSYIEFILVAGKENV